MSQDLTIVSKEINQRPQKVLDHSDYRYLRIVQQNNGGSVTLDNNGGQESVFQIPASQVFNFYRSYLKFVEKKTLKPGETSSGAGGNAADREYRFVDCVPHIRRITVMTQKGQVILCDVPDAHKYTNATLRHETLLDEMLGSDSISADTPTVEGVFEGLCPPNKYTLNTPPAFAAATAGDPTDAELTAAFQSLYSSLNIGTRVADYTEAKNQFIEPRYFITHQAARESMTINNKISLSLFKNTILAMDKNRFFGDVIEIRITWNDKSAIYYKSRASSIDEPLASQTGDSLILDNLELYLCTENNTAIVKDMKDRFVNQGFIDHIPFLYHTKQNKTGQLQHIQIDVNRSQGSHLTKVIWFPANVNEDCGLKYLHRLGTQINTAKAAAVLANSHIVDFNPLLNGNPIYTSSIKCLLNEPYLIQRHKLKGSCITSSNDYNYNFTWYQDWTDPNSLLMQVANKYDPDVYIDGYPLTEPVKYEIDINFGVAGSTRNHYIYSVLLRELTVNANEIKLT